MRTFYAVIATKLLTNHYSVATQNVVNFSVESAAKETTNNALAVQKARCASPLK